MRRARGLTQQGLATRAGLSRAIIADIENNRRRVSIGEAVKLCDALDIPLLRMIGEDALVLTVKIEQK